jgi:hypothetical protein
MKAKHDAEKDTTQQHEVIKQVAEESAADILSVTKLNIYESCDAGLITPEEKDELLAILN